MHNMYPKKVYTPEKASPSSETTSAHFLKYSNLTEGLKYQFSFRFAYLVILGISCVPIIVPPLQSLDLYLQPEAP